MSADTSAVCPLPEQNLKPAPATCHRHQLCPRPLSMGSRVPYKFGRARRTPASRLELWIRGEEPGEGWAKGGAIGE